MQGKDISLETIADKFENELAHLLRPHRQRLAIRLLWETSAWSSLIQDARHPRIVEVGRSYLIPVDQTQRLMSKIRRESLSNLIVPVRTGLEVGVAIDYRT